MHRQCILPRLSQAASLRGQGKAEARMRCAPQLEPSLPTAEGAECMGCAVSHRWTLGADKSSMETWHEWCEHGLQPAPTLRGIGCSGPRCLHPFWLLSDGQSDEREPHERARVAACAARADLARSCGGPLTVVWRSCDGWLTDQGAHGRARVAACAARADLARSCGGRLTVVWRSCDGWLTDQGAHERARVAACAARADLARSCGGWLTVV